MLSLGYSEYVTQGGDWGHVVRFCRLLILVDRPDSLTTLLVDAGVGIPVRSAARQGFPYQSSFVGWFVSLCRAILTHHRSLRAGPMTFWKSPIRFIKFLVTPFTPSEREGLANLIEFQTQGDGYFKVQSTRPQTLGYGLADSPVGMLAWIYEKLVKWTDSYPWTDEEGVCLSPEHPAIYAVVSV